MRRNYGKYTFGVGALFTLALLGSQEGLSDPAYSQKSLGIQSSKNVYIGLSYSPSWHRIQNFSIGASDGSTAARFPSLRNNGTVFGSSFNWQVVNPEIRFNDNSVWAFEGSVGYRKKHTRIELELSYQQFETKGTKLSANSEITETEHLLAKDLAYYVMSGNSEGLGRALAATDPRDIVNFAQALGRASPDIDGKVCNKRVFKRKKQTQKNKDAGAWSCVDHVTNKTSHSKLDTLSKRFGKLGLHDSKRPVDSLWYTNRGWPGTGEDKIDTAAGMASDLVGNLTQEEKAVVASILTETVSGAEVVEIREITATSVIVNACYDAGHAKIVPFACVGVGPSFVTVTDGHMSPKLSCKLKAGLSYAITPRFTLFASAFYHRVFGDEYFNIPVRHLATDVSPEGKSKHDVTATFKMAMTGANFGMRLTF